MHRSGGTQEKQERGGASNVRATQRDTDEAGTHWDNVQKSRTHEKAQAACDHLDGFAASCSVLSPQVVRAGLLLTTHKHTATGRATPCPQSNTPEAHCFTNRVACCCADVLCCPVASAGLSVDVSTMVTVKIPVVSVCIVVGAPPRQPAGI